MRHKLATFHKIWKDDHQHTKGYGKYLGTDGLETALERAKIEKEKAEEIKAILAKPKQVMTDGVWQVPPEDRPKGWEKMGGREL